MKRFVYKEVVTVPLANDAEIVDEGLLNPYFGVELILGDARALVLIPSRLANAANPLWLIGP